MKLNVSLPLVSIVTTVFNGEDYIEKTILSVINQTYPNIQYIIIDAGSTDRTVDIIKKYGQYISYFISEPDNGMYDGLNKGFKHAHGEIMAYLNSDDMYYPGAIEIVVSHFMAHSNVDWITGIGTHYDESGKTTYVGIPEYRFRQLIKKGFYRGDIFGSIQQESTFWRKKLWERCGGFNGELKYAGDYDLWIRFARHSNLYQLQTILGGFRFRKGQKTELINEYFRECDQIFPIKFAKLWKIFRLPVRFAGIIIQLLVLYRHTPDVHKEMHL